MSTKMIEQQLGDLCKRVTMLEAKLKPKPRHGWKQIVGAASNDELFDEAVKAGSEWRAKENRKGR